LAFDTYNPDVVIATESLLSEEIKHADVLRDDYITFSTNGCYRSGGVFICVKNYIDFRVLCTDVVFEMIAVEVKGRNPKFSLEVVAVYRAPNEDKRITENQQPGLGFRIRY